MLPVHRWWKHIYGGDDVPEGRGDPVEGLDLLGVVPDSGGRAQEDGPLEDDPETGQNVETTAQEHPTA
jgi:hypothetical protein